MLPALVTLLSTVEGFHCAHKRGKPWAQVPPRSYVSLEWAKALTRNEPDRGPNEIPCLLARSRLPVWEPGTLMLTTSGISPSERIALTTDVRARCRSRGERAPAMVELRASADAARGCSSLEWCGDREYDLKQNALKLRPVYSGIDDMSAAAALSALPGGDYNALPYTSMPYAYTQPAHLAAVAALFGLEAPAIERARVLELGSASGGNIIPLAARFPSARFLGVDLAQRHIEDGRKRIAALGLANVQLRQADLTQLSLGDEQFDYVICHGVFSWVPTAAQDAIFRICGTTLATNGVAIVSYNVLPGWHMRKIVRDMCLHHVGKDGPPREREAKARQLLEQIAESIGGSEPYGHRLRTEAARIARRPASYILGEFLAEDNAPCYFREFVARAGGYGLSYVCEGDLNSSIPQIRNAEVRRRNRMLAGSDPLALEQYIDFFTGRTFRRSILVKTDHGRSIQRSRRFEHLRSLNFAGDFHLEESPGNEAPSNFKQRRGQIIRVRNPSVRSALIRLARAFPGTLTLKQLTQGSEREENRVKKAIIEMVVAGHITISILPLCVGRAADERPRVSLLARTEAAEGQAWVTSLQHAPVALQPVVSALLPYLDGSNGREKLKHVLAEALLRDEIRVPEFPNDLGSWGYTRVQSVASQYVERTLGYLARHALLEPSLPD